MPIRLKLAEHTQKPEVATLLNFVRQLKRDYLAERNLDITVRVLECLAFIKLNREWISYAIEHKNSDSTLYTYPADQKKRVLRADNDLSFHIINYNTAKEAFEDYDPTIKTIESGIEKIKDNPKLIRIFIHKINDSEVGCMEHRLAQAIEFIANPQVPKLDDLMNKFQLDQQAKKINTNNPFQLINHAVAFFSPELGYSYTFAEKEEILDWSLIKKYLVELLSEDESTFAIDNIGKYSLILEQSNNDNEKPSAYRLDFPNEDYAKHYLNLFRMSLPLVLQTTSINIEEQSNHGASLYYRFSINADLFTQLFPEQALLRLPILKQSELDVLSATITEAVDNREQAYQLNNSSLTAAVPSHDDFQACLKYPAFIYFPYIRGQGLLEYALTRSDSNFLLEWVIKNFPESKNIAKTKKKIKAINTNLVTIKEDSTPLIEAIKAYADLNIIKFLVENGANLGIENKTTVLHAIAEKHPSSGAIKLDELKEILKAWQNKDTETYANLIKNFLRDDKIHPAIKECVEQHIHKIYFSDDNKFLKDNPYHFTQYCLNTRQLPESSITLVNYISDNKSKKISSFDDTKPEFKGADKMRNSIRPMEAEKKPKVVLNAGEVTAIQARKSWTEAVSKTDEANKEYLLANNVVDQLLKRISKLTNSDEKKAQLLLKNCINYLQAETVITVAFDHKKLSTDLSSYQLLNVFETAFAEQDYLLQRSYFEQEQLFKYLANYLPINSYQAFIQNEQAMPRYGALRLIDRNNPIKGNQSYGQCFIELKDNTKLNSLYLPENAYRLYQKNGKVLTPCTFFNLELLLWKCNDSKLKAIISCASKGKIPQNFNQDAPGNYFVTLLPPINLLDNNLVSSIHLHYSFAIEEETLKKIETIFHERKIKFSHSGESHCFSAGDRLLKEIQSRKPEAAENDLTLISDYPSLLKVRDVYGNSILELAAQNDRPRIIELSAKNRFCSHPLAGLEQALIQALAHQNFELAGTLIKKLRENKHNIADIINNNTSYDGWTLLHTATGLGQKKLVEFLLEQGADIYKTSRYVHAFELDNSRGDVNVFNDFKDELLNILTQGNLEQLKLFNSQKTNVISLPLNSKKEYALEIALRNNQQEMVETLLTWAKRVSTLHLMPDLPENTDSLKGHYTYVKKTLTLNNSEKKIIRELYLIKLNGELEAITINNFDLFDSNINTLEQADNSIQLSEKQFQQIITENGGHTNSKNHWHNCLKSGLKYAINKRDEVNAKRIARAYLPYYIASTEHRVANQQDYKVYIPFFNIGLGYSAQEKLKASSALSHYLENPEDNESYLALLAYQPLLQNGELGLICRALQIDFSQPQNENKINFQTNGVC